MLCMRCMFVMADSDKRCPRCGEKPQKIDPSAGASLDMPSQPGGPLRQPVDYANLKCPKCQNPDVVPVSVVVHDGSWREESSWSEQSQINARTTSGSFGVALSGGHATPILGVSTGRTRGQANTHGSGTTTGSTRLAQRMAEPNKPVEPVQESIPSGCVQCVFWFALLAIGGAAAEAISWFFGILGILSVVIFIACYIGSVLQHKEALQQYDEQVKEWHKNLYRWNKLYYCSRCVSAFNPETGRTAALSGFSSLVYND